MTRREEIIRLLDKIIIAAGNPKLDKQENLDYIIELTLKIKELF